MDPRHEKEIQRKEQLVVTCMHGLGSFFAQNMRQIITFVTNIRTKLIHLYIMGIKDKIRPTWLGVLVTIVAMLITFALTVGSDRNQIQTNKEDIKGLEIKTDVYYQNQMQMIEDIGEIKGYIKATHDGKKNN